MSSDFYKVEVLYYLHPHLIWTEVSDGALPKSEEFVFEQIGIYGVLPLEPTVSVEDGDVASQRCERWVPAATALMQKYLHNATEVYFSPVYIDRRSSIFDDNVHKYGDLIITQPNGKIRKLSKLLIKYGIAIKDECVFHQELCTGHIRTKLSNHETVHVLKELDKYYLKKDCTKKQWEKAVKKQTKVFHEAQNFESALTTKNLEMHNMLSSGSKCSTVDELAQKKLKDFQMCKGTDEVSAGRGISRSTQSKNDSVSPQDGLSSALHKRKSLIKDSSKKNPLQMILASKRFLDVNAVGNESRNDEVYSQAKENKKEVQVIQAIKCFLDDNVVENESRNKEVYSQAKENKKEVQVIQAIKSFLDDNVVENKPRNKEVYSQAKENKKEVIKEVMVEKEDRHIEKKQNDVKVNIETIKEEKQKFSTERKPIQSQTAKKNEKEDRHIEKNQNKIKVNIETIKEEKQKFSTERKPIQSQIAKKNCKSPKSPNEVQQKLTARNLRPVAFGPPEIDKSKWNVKPAPFQNYDATESVFPPKNCDVEVTNQKDDMFCNEDSDIDVERPRTVEKEIPKIVEENKNPVAKTPDRIDGTPKQKTNNAQIEHPKSHNSTTNNAQIEHPNSHNSTTNNAQIEHPKSHNSTTKDTKKSTSVLKKRLQLYKECKSKTKACSMSSSDTSNKDSSTSIEDVKPNNSKVTQDSKSEMDSDDESALEVLEKIKLEYPVTKKSPEEKEPDESKKTALKKNVNPFENIDPNMSVFTDKLLTPVLMVHTKHNMSIQPTFVLRDVPFNSHIQIVLKNMSVDKHMMLQSITWLSILRGYSTFVVGPKGSGKTMGYLPALCHLVSDAKIKIDSKGPIGIVVCATASSVCDVERLSKIFFGNKEKVLACYTGMDELALTTSLLNGCDLLICTPAILVRMLQTEDFGVDLRRLLTFVLDDCERLSEVYGNEIKFFLMKIKDMLKRRIVKELKVQYVVASRTWCDFMEPLAKKAPDTVICIGAFQECVLYSKASTTATFVTAENKINSVFNFLEQIDSSKKTVIVCRHDEEVKSLEAALKKTKHVVFASNNSMTVQELPQLSKSWNNDHDPANGPILVCCDGNLTHLNVTDAHHLVHYSLPHLFSMFCKRFAVLNDNYASIFRNENENVKIKILLEDSNVEQLPKILHFIKRCTNDVPKVLDEVSEKVLIERDLLKAKNLIPICDNLLTLGKCPDFWNCQDRHAVIKEYDQPKNWMPTEGFISFRILHYHNAVLYSARLLSNTSKGQTTKYPQTFNTLTMKIATYYAKESNRKLHGVPNVGDICAVAVRQNFFERCQVVKILNRYQSGNPNYVLVKLIDKEMYERSRDIYLFYLPEEMITPETHVVQVRLANIQPKDKDVTFSKLAQEQLVQITEKDKDLYLRGEIVLVVGNCVFVNNLDTCRDLTSMKNTVVRHNFKQELAAHAITNPDHIPKLEEICENSGIPVLKKTMEEFEVIKPVNVLPKGCWAHLDSEELPSVYFASAETPGTFFVRLVKFEDCMNSLIDEIQKNVAENNEILIDPSKGDIVLARLPDDGMYERARIEEVFENKVRCFFVDQGDWREVEKKYLYPITEKFITRLPFQAIECRMVGVKPAGEDWTEFSTNWFINCCEDSSGNLKQLYVKYFKKEKAEFTEGHKYAVALIDTNMEDDVIVNKIMIDVNMASEDDEEIGLLSELNYTNTVKVKTEESDSTADEDEWEKISKKKTEEEDIEFETPKVPLEDIFPKKPLRSVPLVTSDCDSDEEKWNINMTDDLMALFKPLAKSMNLSLPAIQNNDKMPKIILTDSESIDTSSHSDIQVIPSPQKMCKTLDSDDLTSPETTQVSVKMDEIIEVEDLRKPKVCWRQDRSSISIKIMLIGVKTYTLEIEDRSLEFSTEHNDTKYGFKFDLYGVIDSKSSNHSNKGQYILVNLNKISKTNWLTLAKDGPRKWVAYDLEHLEASDEEVSVVDDTRNIIKNHFDNSETESEDDFVDDVNFKYSR